ncbi:hypothetical protein CEXT_752461 [Caerostris extrusa]|uniref:Uncharacterized protein n=1 Tax=Caerostris extrusa TaxID=172846 RepID=A0AAV4X248_CAEEX|nr:hypothetical protein CEXT_752461 [Caerostris extrusa]
METLQPLRSAPSCRGESLCNIHRRAIPLTFITEWKLLSWDEKYFISSAVAVVAPLVLLGLSGCIFYWSSDNTEAARNGVLTIVGVVWGEGEEWQFFSLVSILLSEC